jgi:NAD(P)H-nitrite reductase large subunit
VDVGSFGDPFGETPGTIPIVFQNKLKGTYKRINISADGKYLLGGILIGDGPTMAARHVRPVYQAGSITEVRWTLRPATDRAQHRLRARWTSIPATAHARC